jgi:predicted nucleic acid-binding protein
MASYILDTNAYALFFQNPKPSELLEIERLLKVNGVIEFYIPEIVSMEIHSVLGKYRRGGSGHQEMKCGRQILGEGNPLTCAHTCIFPARKRMSAKIFGGLRKLIRDIEAGRGDIRATIIPIAEPEISAGRKLLHDYADRFSFGSHDALVAATASLAIHRGLSLVLVTSDKGLKAVCAQTSLPVFDPAA